MALIFITKFMLYEVGKNDLKCDNVICTYMDGTKKLHKYKKARILVLVFSSK